MKMNPERNRAKARASPVSGALCGPSTVISEQGCLGAYAPINFTRDTQKKYFDPIRRGRVKKLGQKGRV
ncbi:hypothetical protein ACFX2J_000643 [Malus domestica]